MYSCAVPEVGLWLAARTILCVGLNYPEHVAEGTFQRPGYPAVFGRWTRSLTVSGTPAPFLAGGEYPIPVPQALGVTTIEYKDYGVSLTFVATVLDGNRINLVVKPEVSELTSQGAVTINGSSVPALTIRRGRAAERNLGRPDRPRTATIRSGQ